MNIQKRGIFVALLVLLISCNCAIVYAGDVYGNYGGNAQGYVHTFMVESGFGQHRANASAELLGSDSEFIGEHLCGYQFGGTATWGKLCGYGTYKNTKHAGQKSGYFTYTNAWLEMNNGEYIDSPIGH